MDLAGGAKSISPLQKQFNNNFGEFFPPPNIANTILVSAIGIVAGREGVGVVHGTCFFLGPISLSCDFVLVGRGLD